MKLSAIAAVTVALITATCAGGGADRTVPRPEGFPRIEGYPASYTPLPGLSVTFEANDSARVVPSDRKPANSGDRWVTLSYPRYGALLYLTFTNTTPAKIDAVIGNRLERMSLNSGTARAEMTELISPDGWASRIMTTRTATVTPVQFLSVSPHGTMVVSGAAFIDGMDTASSPDSLAPVITLLEADIIHALKHLK